ESGRNRSWRSTDVIQASVFGQRCFDGGAQFRCDLRVQSEPEPPRDARLMEQHPEAVYRRIAPATRGGQQRCVERNVDNVDDERGGWKRVETEVERRLADHPLARGGDDALWR